MPPSAETPDGSPPPAETPAPAAGPSPTPLGAAPPAAQTGQDDAPTDGELAADPPAVTPPLDTSPLLVAPEDEPELGEYLRDRWEAVPKAARLAVGVLGVALVALWFVGLILNSREPLSDDEIVRRAEVERAEWSASLRQAPMPLTDSLVTGELLPGDAETSDGSYADYYAFEAPDSVAYVVVVTSADFAPDLAVRLPDGRTLAASNLLRTQTRAEITNLRGPGRFDISVRSQEPNATGSYDLSVQRVVPIDTVYVDDEPIADSLGSGLRRMGRYERPFGIVADSENPVVIRVVSEDFVPQLSLLGPNGEVTGEWRTAQTISRGDSLHAAVIRFLPGWERAPYRLLVSSAEPGATGTFALEATSLIPRAVSADGRSASYALDEDSWVSEGRYVDYFTFRAQAGDRTVIQAQSDQFPPALRLWRSVRREQKEVVAALNEGGASSARIERELEPGEYVLEVTAGGSESDSLRVYGGGYTLKLETVRPEPPPPSATPSRPTPSSPSPSGATPESKVFSTSASGRGTTGGSTFEVRVTHATLSYPGGRTRVQLSVSVESIDYSGTWAPWSSFVSKGYVLDDKGRRYTSAGGSSPSGEQAEPGTVRRGTVVFFASGVNADVERLLYVAPLGGASVRLNIPVP